MASPLGWFDPGLRIEAWFDPALLIEAWFDPDLIGEVAAAAGDQVPYQPWALRAPLQAQ